MYILALLQPAFVVTSVLFAAAIRTVADKKKRPTTWLIDGNNFLGQKGTPRDGDILAERLRPIATTAAEQGTSEGRCMDMDRTRLVFAVLFSSFFLLSDSVGYPHLSLYLLSFSLQFPEKSFWSLTVEREKQKDPMSLRDPCFAWSI
mmetsp:Transcript_9781/g.17876  ORF Transcript_9781/g.17876 Transcript_9781/m.17876 type:complete len:147 (+) Transcript_9781:182-622(+)